MSVYFTDAVQQKPFGYDPPYNREGGRRFVAYCWFVGWDCVSIGFHVCFSLPNIEIHLPFSFIRIGWVDDPRDPSLDEADAILIDACTEEIQRIVALEKPVGDLHPDWRFCMVHMKFEPDVAIYIDGKRALFLCPQIAEERGAWKWEGKWPDGR